MINFRIVSIPHVPSTLLRTWIPDDWPMVREQLNPWADPFIARIDLLIYNLKRQVWIRSPEVVEYFFARFDFGYVVQIEAELDWYLSELIRYLNIRTAYIRDFLLDSDIEKFMNRKPDSKWAQHHHPVPDPDDLPYLYGPQSIYRYAGESFESKDHQFYSRSLDLIKESGDSLPTAKYVNRNQIRKSPPTFLPYESIIHDSFNHLLFELSRAAVLNNALIGAGAKQRAVLVNGSIPVPNRYTILGWWALCGLDLSRYMEAAHLVTYILPSMPMTQEHVHANAIPGEDSGSDQSLGYKSSAHDRKPNGRIVHGKWECNTVLLNDSDRDEVHGKRHLVSRRVIKNGQTAAFSLVGHAHSMLPGKIATPFLPWQRIMSPLPDPYLASYEPMSMVWPRLDPALSFDTMIRAMAKWFRVHFRFDDDEIGTLAAEEWRLAFESELLAMLARDQTETLLVQFDAALIRQSADKINPPLKPGKKPMIDFGFDKFF